MSARVVSWGKEVDEAWSEEAIWAEIEWVVVDTNPVKTAVCVVYVGSEGLTEWNDLINEWLRAQVVDIQEKGWRIVIGGDFNAHIGNRDAGIVGNNKEVHSNGRRLVEFTYGMDTGDWKPLARMQWSMDKNGGQPEISP